MIILFCDNCGDIVLKTKSLHDAAVRRGQERHYCSKSCATAAGRTAMVEINCEQCGVKFQRRRADMKRSSHIFCSTACSNHARKRARVLPATVPCVLCGNFVRQSNRRKLGRCLACVRATLGRRTKGDLFHARCSWQSARSAIQKMARQVYLASELPLSCQANTTSGSCGYTKHVEVAHRKDVSAFPDDALLIEINDPSNLVGLCPTHHWEFDHGELDQSL